MITLKNLSKVSKQKVFDQVATHLLKQNRVSYKDDMAGICAYRGPNGLKCAAGCLIADSEYNPSWEAEGWNMLVARGEVPTAHKALIRDLQKIHDEYNEQEWREQLFALADSYNLHTKALS